MNGKEINTVSETSVNDDQATFISDYRGINTEKITSAIEYLKENFPSYRSISVFQNESMVFNNMNEKPYE